MPSFAGLDIDDEEIIPDILAQKPKIEDHLGSTVIVDGCPVVGPAKFELLRKFLLDKFSKIGPIVDHEFPLDNEKQTKGYIFITYENGKAASQAVRTMNNTPLDKNHTFQVTLLSDFERATDVPTEWIPPPKQEYKDLGNLKSWLLNEFCRDQFAVVYNDGETGSVYWHTPVEPVIAEERARWTDGWMRWSPRGTYLATMHPLGVILWGGEKFQRIGRFPHSGVKTIEFSPMEQFMITLSPSANFSTDERADAIVWDVKRCVSRREFSVPIDFHPVFRWSPKDEYFACLRDGVISVYCTSNFRLLDKKKLGSNVRDFSWSPSDNSLAYWVPESDNTPARVVLMELPSRQELCTKNLFSVAEINLLWHEQGDFLAVQVLRCAKKKLDGEKQVKYVGTYTNFEIVRLREKLYPVDQLEVKGTVSNFQWEPSGTRFAFLQSVTSGKLSVAIYDVSRGSNIREVTVLDLASPRTNDLRWSPKGGIIVATGLRSADGILEFISANDGQILAKGEHPTVSDVQWDPTGRYLATTVSSFYQKNDNAIWFWNCVGRCLFKMNLSGIRTFTWRPRPPTLLSAEQLQTIKRNMPKYNSQLANEDRMLASKASRELFEKRQKLLTEFNAWKSNLIKLYNQDEEERFRLRGTSTDISSSGETQTEEELELLINAVHETIRKNTEE
uniref:Eukaryotic translation initiation factor 3 subunit B n=1 Tax=Schistosoma japonicum TaxID=6182 RepID=C1LJ92_SCHJA|nr:putative Eukaryotic translation initiation factor 3 subunit 9 [Schistosoma japonicum]CAX74770.1 putative Eukaryotic translation initiation factor 3 subunit 9 [Schistosoma japonicum]